MKRLLSFLLQVGIINGLAVASVAAEPIAIGSNRELFLDNHVIEKISGDAQLALQQPVPQKVALVTGAPWEETRVPTTPFSRTPTLPAR